MTKRKQIIHHELIRLTNTLRDKFTTDLTKVLGFDANTIGHNLGIARNCCKQRIKSTNFGWFSFKNQISPRLFFR